jgi:integrase
LFGDVPKRDESLPKFLDDGDFAKFMRTLADEPTLFRRLAIEMLARTGMRVGELCDLEDDAVTITNGDRSRVSTLDSPARDAPSSRRPHCSTPA